MSPIWSFVTPVPVGANENPTFTFVDEQHGWVARGRNLVATTDGGKDWQLQAMFAGTISSVDFLSRTDGWAATDKGLYATKDGGTTWLRLTGAPDSVGRVDFVDGQHGWISASKQGLLATHDGGLSWTKATSPCYPQYGPPAPFAGLFHFIDPLTGWTLCNSPTPGAGMDARTLYKTADGGQTWTLIAEGDLPGSSEGSPTPTTNTLPTSRYSSDLFMLDDTTGWIADNVGVFGTTDGGRTWRQLGAYLPGLAEDPNAKVWRGPWQAYSLYGYPDVRAVIFLTATRGFALREEQDTSDETGVHEVPVLYESRDGGATWTQLQCGFGSPCASAAQTPSPQ